uniref:Mitochondrial ribosomal protein S16 n=1 Tax=Rhizophora mucronata TaxID=61149 RepID=A0A2P2JE91_RHIMU
MAYLLSNVWSQFTVFPSSALLDHLPFLCTTLALADNFLAVTDYLASYPLCGEALLSIKPMAFYIQRYCFVVCWANLLWNSLT